MPTVNRIVWFPVAGSRHRGIGPITWSYQLWGFGVGKTEEEEMIQVHNKQTGKDELHRRNPTMWDRVREETVMNPELAKEIGRQREMVKHMYGKDED